MKTFFAIYNDSYTKRQFIIAANDKYEAEATAYASEVGEFSDGTKFYPNADDFTITEIKGAYSRGKKSGIIQYV